jgi:trigger factor
MANLSRSEVKSLSSVERELSIVISSDGIKREIDQAYQRLSTQVRLKGFRPGKVPRNVLEHYYRADVEKDVLNRLLNKSYQEAITTHSLDPVAEPQIKLEQTFTQGTDFSFSATVEVRPQIELKMWEGLELSVPELTLSDAAVDAEIEAMRDAHATIVPVTDRDSILQGDVVECNFSGTVDGAHAKGLSGLNQVIEVGSGQFFAHAEQAMIGHKINDSVEVTVTLPENVSDEAYRGKDAVLTIVPTSIKMKQKPVLDDEFAKDVSDQFNTLEDLRKAIHDEMAHAKATRENEMKENAAIDALVMQNPFDVPQSLIQRQAEQQAQRALASLPKEQAESIWREHAAALTEEAKPLALKTVRATLLCDAIARALKINIADSEIDSEFATEAARMRVSIHKLRSYYNADDIDAMRRRLAAGKALKMVVEKAHVKVVPGLSPNA